jgi:Tol biopolymer transport system component
VIRLRPLELAVRDGRASRFAHCALLCLVGSLLIVPITKGAVGIFTEHADIGSPRHGGTTTSTVDRSADTYTISGGGANMWGTSDSFHFVWKKVSGDLTLTAKVRFAADGGNPHRKACLLIRQSLDADSPYADAALHGDGLTSLQYREAAGARTYEIQSLTSAPASLRIVRRGKYVSMSVAREGEELHPSGGAIRLNFDDPVYVGLGVCAHDDAARETAIFTNVVLMQPPPSTATRVELWSTLETVSIDSKDRRAIHTTRELIEAPNWSRDGATLFINCKGRIHRLPATGGATEVIDTGFATRCNNDHGLSPDGALLALSDQSQERHSIIYTVPVKGGTPQRVTKLGPSYWHGWSPDGTTLAYCAQRDGEFDIYSIPANGGEETRLTDAHGLDDGPDYSPDGRFIYFNSERSATMQIWRMRTDGSAQEQVTFDDFNNWFPHPSPDGKWLVFLSYAKDVKGHPENKDVSLRIMPLTGGKAELLASLFGGQGTINVPSWSPDSRKVAFVSYQLLPSE